jgi:hypothetical protein
MRAQLSRRLWQDTNAGTVHKLFLSCLPSSSVSADGGWEQDTVACENGTKTPIGCKTFAKVSLTVSCSGIGSKVGGT